MAVKTPFSRADFELILAQYALGTFLEAQPIAQGTVQTNYFLHTTQGKFVFRCYENRTPGSVRFECQLLAYLNKRNYPCPRPCKNRRGGYVGEFHQRPCVLFEFIPGQTMAQPSAQHHRQLIQKAAELHQLTRAYRPRLRSQRWNYSADLCRDLARAAAARLANDAAQRKLAWLEQQLADLQLPRALPKGICHCDFHTSNVLFQDDQFAALLDFDDANYTFLLFDLVGLIETQAWPYPAQTLNLAEARAVLREYTQYRPLNALEQHHLFDVFKLGILIDCVWYFGRGGEAGFYEKDKIDALNRLGRAAFFNALFRSPSTLE